MNNAIVNNRLFILLLTILFYSFFGEKSFSQIVNLKNDYTESITIPKIDDEKVKVFIFSKAGKKNLELSRLQNNLNALEALNLIDFSKFTIYSFTITSNDSNEVCVIKNLTLDGDELLPSFNYDPFYIILKTNKTYNEYLSYRPEIGSSKTISYVTNKQSEKTQFVSFSDDRVLINLLRSGFVSQNDSLLKSRLAFLESKVVSDSVFLANKATTIKNDRYLGLQYSILFLFSLSGLNDTEISKSIESDFSLSLNYLSIPVSKKIGFKCNLQFSQTTFQLKNKSDLIDFTGTSYLDSADNEYQETIIANNINENLTTKAISFTPQLVYKLKRLVPDLDIYISPGLKISSVLSATYSASNGTLRYGGKYTISGVDTVFTGQSFINNSIHHLQIKDINASLYLPITASYHFNKNWFVNLGFSYELGLSNILNNESNGKFISSSQNEYNSLLYRQDKISINCLNLEVGVSYKLSK